MKISCRKNSPEEIEFLVFTIGSVRFGADTEQVAEIYEPEPSFVSSSGLIRFDREIGFKEEFSLPFPRLVILREDRQYAGILINEPEDIISVSLNDIRPLPDLLNIRLADSPLWGAALAEDGIILLTDFYKMLSGSSKKAQKI